MQPKKHVMSSMQSGLPKQSSSCVQHDCATQSPHSLPSEGHALKPQVPARQVPEQHSGSSLQSAPSGEQAASQTPPLQLPEQHSNELPHMPPSGVHAFWQTPPTQVPLQQLGPVMQGPPLGVHWLHCAPQICSASETQMLSHEPWQQNGSWAHTC
jgi:hypothetical protein